MPLYSLVGSSPCVLVCWNLWCKKTYPNVCFERATIVAVPLAYLVLRRDVRLCAGCTLIFYDLLQVTDLQRTPSSLSSIPGDLAKVCGTPLHSLQQAPPYELGSPFPATKAGIARLRECTSGTGLLRQRPKDPFARTHARLVACNNG